MLATLQSAHNLFQTNKFHTLWRNFLCETLRWIIFYGLKKHNDYRHYVGSLDSSYFLCLTLGILCAINSLKTSITRVVIGRYYSQRPRRWNHFLWVEARI